MDFKLILIVKYSAPGLTFTRELTKYLTDL